MTAEERAEMSYLCEKIATVKDGEVFDALVRELNALLDKKHKRIHPDHNYKPDSN